MKAHQLASFAFIAAVMQQPFYSAAQADHAATTTTRVAVANDTGVRYAQFNPSDTIDGGGHEPVKSTGNAGKDRENTVAVLPMYFIGNDAATKAEQMPFYLQELAVAYLQKEARQLQYQDPAETNALLEKAGVTLQTIRSYAPKELAGILKVDYMVSGTVVQESGAFTTVTNNNAASERKINPKPGGYEMDHKSNSMSVTSANREMKTTVTVTVYNEKGENIFRNSRKSLLTGTDAYKNCLYYQLKRIPVYKQ